jgi:hypothetical protein
MNFRLTVAMVIVLLVVAGTFVGLKYWSSKAPETSAAKTNLVFPSDKSGAAGIKSVEYSTDGAVELAFARGDKGWRLTKPVDAQADSVSVEKVTSVLGDLSYTDKFEPAAAGGRSAETTGVAKPRHVVKFTDESGKEHTLALGKRAVSGVYATADGGSTIYLLERNPLDALDADPSSFRSKQIEEIPAEKVAGLTIKQGDRAVTLTKADNKWMITAPVTARASVSAVEAITNELRNLRASSFSDVTDRRATGLSPPRVSVTALVEETAAAPGSAPASGPASRAATKPVTLDLGYYTDPTSKKFVYASVAGSNEVFTLPSSTFDKLNRDLSDLRDPVVLPAAETEATRVDIAPAGGEPVTLSREGGSAGKEWSVSSPSISGVPGDPGAAGSLLTALRELRASKFVDAAGDLKSIGLDPPAARVELTLPTQARHEVLLIGKPETADNVTPVMVQGEPTVYLVKSDEVAKLTPGVLALRDRAIERLTADRIRQVEIRPATGAATVLRREGTTWKVERAGGATENADETKVTSLLADFTPVTATKFVSTKADVSGAPDVTVTVGVLESAASQPASAPATGPATGPAAATLPSELQAAMNRTSGPDAGRTVTRTLRLYKAAATTAPASGMSGAGWRAVWEGGGGPAWTFEPTALLAEHVTTTAYAVAATQPASAPATQGAATAP